MNVSIPSFGLRTACVPPLCPGSQPHPRAVISTWTPARSCHQGRQHQNASRHCDQGHADATQHCTHSVDRQRSRHHWFKPPVDVAITAPLRFRYQDRDPPANRLWTA